MTPVISFEAVGLTYAGPPPVQALRPTDLVVNRGEYVTVVGPSGAGKSTFLNVVGLLDRPTEGVYRLDGVNVSDCSEAQRTALRGRRIGFVFQAFHVLPYRTATENVALGLLYGGIPRKERAREAQLALASVGLAHRRDSLPSKMSGGERQRVAIARALVHRPTLLLCDEPTGNLDSETTDDILELLDQLNERGHTLVVITHDPKVAGRGRKQIVIRDGSIDG